MGVWPAVLSSKERFHAVVPVAAIRVLVKETGTSSFLGPLEHVLTINAELRNSGQQPTRYP